MARTAGWTTDIDRDCGDGRGKEHNLAGRAIKIKYFLKRKKEELKFGHVKSEMFMQRPTVG